jgi:hypothetical protein
VCMSAVVTMMLGRIVGSMPSSVLFLHVPTRAHVLFGPIFDNFVSLSILTQLYVYTRRALFGRRAGNLAVRQNCARMLCSCGGRLSARNNHPGLVSLAQAEVVVCAVRNFGGLKEEESLRSCAYPQAKTNTTVHSSTTTRKQHPGVQDRGFLVARGRIIAIPTRPTGRRQTCWPPMTTTIPIALGYFVVRSVRSRPR